mmetsp:Transcript_10636/g.15565  ORF Transcript_10636/g.15565 Transcript_10636/m.15565 type:complete len:723 (+) Transcript_10636:173-2341(+)|eukprot:CAMPEP_0195532980 /NCGR_PEP_ID=MMETSP0794_2-20130614/39533_1 /TAXON_ID=515487 /ORGANISM="Stephanopyxis turris, Strain CCMP 815" /LENGTH=722 /DNA_ID=CAMNT_0040665369 /DNA_START=172 /DNA_END=2340 /DNA_ORIENTATION=+
MDHNVKNIDSGCAATNYMVRSEGKISNRRERTIRFEMYLGYVYHHNSLKMVGRHKPAFRKSLLQGHDYPQVHHEKKNKTGRKSLSSLAAVTAFCVWTLSLPVASAAGFLPQSQSNLIIEGGQRFSSLDNLFLRNTKNERSAASFAILPKLRKNGKISNRVQGVCTRVLRMSSFSNMSDDNGQNKKKRDDNNSTDIEETRDGLNDNGSNNTSEMKEMMKRIIQLERLVSTQAVDIERLKQECKDLNDAASTFSQVVELLRQAGLDANTPEQSRSTRKADKQQKEGDLLSDDTCDEAISSDEAVAGKGNNSITSWEYEYYDDSEIFGSAPSSVIDAADTAGAAILAAMLAGKLRMLVDVRDAELSRDPDILVQFIELAILPVAAGLEGLTSERNRVKIVFPTVSQLLQYRKTMALSAPEVVALSTLGIGSVEEKDNIVVFIAPSPDDEEGLARMAEILNPENSADAPRQPVVVLNHHMLPIAGPVSEFSVAYHLRLLSVQYMTGDTTPEYVEKVARSFKPSRGAGKEAGSKIDDNVKEGDVEGDNENDGTNVAANIDIPPTDAASAQSMQDGDKLSDDDAALEAAMTHAHESGVHQGITRAMVIRAYPRPWHVFVDTSPDADADFEVAATFDEEPSQDEVNYAIVECLEGSEREDDLVAQQMQEALEAGQLNKVSEMLGISPDDDPYMPRSRIKSDDEEDNGDEDDQEPDDYYDFDDFDPYVST